MLAFRPDMVAATPFQNRFASEDLVGSLGSGGVAATLARVRANLRRRSGLLHETDC